MIILHDPHAREKDAGGWMATVGFFDGVHRGHRFLIGELRRLADKQGLPAGIMTFPVHPRTVLQTDYRPRLLNSYEEKLEHLEATGVDYCAVPDFTPALAKLSAREFITDVLAQQWGVRALLIGYDHRFGHNRTESFEQYAVYGAACGMEVFRAPSFGTASGAISSSCIRRRLVACRVEEAAQWLAYAYRLKGHVTGGRRIGRILGFPTANIRVDDPLKVWPGMGVYAVWVHMADVRHKGMLSIGNRPTFQGEEVAIEVHLLHFHGDLYDQSIEVEFIRYLRPNRKFDSPKALRVQLSDDRHAADAALEG